MPLTELMHPFMKLSNNMHAEALTKTIGRTVSGAGTWDAGLAAVRTDLEGRGVDIRGVRQADGSGLSRMNLFPAEALTTLLLSARGEPWYAAWYDALPVACAPDRAVGGTLRSRMCSTPAALNARAKTGSLTGASALSGYVTDAAGRELVYSVVLNNYLASSVKSVEDAVVVTLASSDTAGGTVRGPPLTGPDGGARRRARVLLAPAGPLLIPRPPALRRQRRGMKKGRAPDPLGSGARPRVRRPEGPSSRVLRQVRTGAAGRLLDRRDVRQRGLLLAAEGELLLLTLALGVDDHDVTGAQLAEEDLLRQDVLDLALDRPAQRPGAQHGS
ncbi:D-alanyl-D-alanine carboxypeptidase/D-alanyl-D-alanine-endopeptidase [Streptomyces zhihengii]